VTESENSLPPPRPGAPPPTLKKRKLDTPQLPTTYYSILWVPLNPVPSSVYQSGWMNGLWLDGCLAFFSLIPVLVVTTLVSSTVQLLSFFSWLSLSLFIYLFIYLFIFFFDTLGNGQNLGNNSIARQNFDPWYYYFLLLVFHLFSFPFFCPPIFL
jgi:hypothetical protein